MDCSLTDDVVADYAQQYAPSISLKQAAEIADVSILTIYDWSSRGELDAFKSRRGRRVRLVRDEFVRYLFESN